MKIIIAGAGVVGFQTAKKLSSENKDVVLIEKDPVLFAKISERLDCIVLNDDISKPRIMKKAGMENADLFICVTGSDEINIISCALAHSEFKVPKIIARISNPDYRNTALFTENRLGIDYVINPEEEAADVIVNSILYGATGDVKIFKHSGAKIRSFIVQKNSILAGKTVKQINQQQTHEFIICGILRNNEFIIPDGNTTFKTGDNVYISGSDAGIDRVLSSSGTTQQLIKRVIFAGGSRIARYAARQLSALDIDIVFIENNSATCGMLSEMFPRSLVLQSEISDETIFEEERLGTCDLLAAVTDEQELNIITALYAKSIGITRTIALVANSNFFNIASHLNIDITVSQKDGAVDSIMKYIRKGNISGIYSIFEGKAEVMETVIGSDSPLTSVLIRDIKNAAAYAYNRDYPGRKNTRTPWEFIHSSQRHCGNTLSERSNTSS